MKGFLDMSFDIMKWFEDESYISPGSIGGKIKKYRELKGWSQKELGVRCGFSPSTADVRIAQYEKNRKIPRDKVLKDIANALGIDEYALYDTDLLPYSRMYHILFDIEDIYGLHPVKKDDGYYLEFSGDTILDQRVMRGDYESFLEIWYEMRQKYQPNYSDSSEEKKQKQNDYTIWRAEYPMNEARKHSEQLRDAMRERHLQAELDELHAKKNRESEIKRINDSLVDILPEVKKLYSPIKYESDLIFLIKDIIEKGLPLERFSPEERFEIDYDNIHLFSVKSEDILKSEENKRLYSSLLCAIETLQKYKININQSITSKNKELYVTYKYPSSQYGYFENLQHSWEDIKFIIERKPWWSQREIDELEEQLQEKITGENDVLFSDDV